MLACYHAADRSESPVTIYCLCVEYLAAIGHRDDYQATLTTAEVITVALVAARFFKGCLESSRQFLVEHGYMRQMLSKSRLNRRLHAIPEGLWLGLFALLAESAKRLNPDQEYAVDSLPVPMCDNIRISRCRLYQDEAYRDYIASKRRYFYGLRVHVLVTAQGVPCGMYLDSRSGRRSDRLQNAAAGSTTTIDHLCRPRLQRLPVRRPAGRSGLPLRSTAAQRFQAASSALVNVSVRPYSQAYRNNVQRHRGTNAQVYPCRDATRL